MVVWTRGSCCGRGKPDGEETRDGIGSECGSSEMIISSSSAPSFAVVMSFFGCCCSFGAGFSGSALCPSTSGCTGANPLISFPSCGFFGGCAVGGTGVLVGAFGTLGGGLLGRLVDGECVRSYVGSTGGCIGFFAGLTKVASWLEPSGTGVEEVPATAPPGTGGSREPSVGEAVGVGDDDADEEESAAASSRGFGTVFVPCAYETCGSELTGRPLEGESGVSVSGFFCLP